MTIPHDQDFAALMAAASDSDSPGVIDFYATWVPRVSGVPSASVKPVDGDSTHTIDDTVFLNARDVQHVATPAERLAALHAAAWHEVGHVRHPVSEDRMWALLTGPDNAPLAFQALKDLRIERELVIARVDAKPWLASNVSHSGGLTNRALANAAASGWPLAATIYAGRHVAGVVSDAQLAQLCAADLSMEVQVDALRPTWEAFSVLSDPERDATAGDELIADLAKHL